MHHNVVLIPGDGIGPEVTEAVTHILAAVTSGSGGGSGVEIEWIEHQAGLAALEAGSDEVLPTETIQAIKEHGVALKGPCTTPVGGGFSSVNVALRKTLNLYGAVRPIRSLEGVKTRYETEPAAITIY